jgi:hypothetical protein
MANRCGVLDLYARVPRAFSAVDRQSAELLAGQAAIAVTAALRHYDEVILAGHLRIALSSRSVIDQAIGIVMAQQGGGPEEAFAALRTISQRRNINSAPSPPSWSTPPATAARPPHRKPDRASQRCAFPPTCRVCGETTPQP